MTTTTVHPIELLLKKVFHANLLTIESVPIGHWVDFFKGLCHQGGVDYTELKRTPWRGEDKIDIELLRRIPRLFTMLVVDHKANKVQWASEDRQLEVVIDDAPKTLRFESHLDIIFFVNCFLDRINNSVI